jgi:hypothetical protein
MPKQDIYHDTVRRALMRDGWTITHDPFTLRPGKKRLFVNLGASRLISAESIVKFLTGKSQSEFFILLSQRSPFVVSLSPRSASTCLPMTQFERWYLTKKAR